MAGFFCLSGSELETPLPPPTTTTRTSNKQQEGVGGSENHHHHQRNQGNNNSLFLFRNEEIYNNNNKGFEIWPQYHQNEQQNLSNYYSFGVVPSNRSISRISNNNNNNDDNDNVSDESATRLDFAMMRQGSLGSGGMNCQDCGNQAKKDCAHLRCRTCCKSRGFHCPTHVKSTWVPAARRRERQQQLTALQQQQLQIQQQQQQQQNQQFRVDHPKRQRDPQASTSLRIPTTNTSGLEIGAAFPPELNSPALFRCIKMNSIDEPGEQFAYQTAVNIGGHVFKGVLYDQGPDSNYTSSTAGDGGGGDQQLNLITTAPTTTGNPSASIIDPNSLYPTSFNAFMSGTHFFQSPRS